MRGVLANRRRTADTPNLAAQGQSVSRKTVAEVSLTGLSLAGASGGDPVPPARGGHGPGASHTRALEVEPQLPRGLGLAHGLEHANQCFGGAKLLGLGLLSASTRSF